MNLLGTLEFSHKSLQPESFEIGPYATYMSTCIRVCAHGSRPKWAGRPRWVEVVVAVAAAAAVIVFAMVIVVVVMVVMVGFGLWRVMVVVMVDVVVVVMLVL